MGTFPWANRAIVTGNVKVDTRDCRDAPRCWCSIEGRWGASSRPPRTVTYPRPHPTSRAICPTEGTSRKRRKRIFRPAFRHCQPAHCPYRFELAPEIRRSDIFFFFFFPLFFSIVRFSTSDIFRFVKCNTFSNDEIDEIFILVLSFSFVFFFFVSKVEGENSWKSCLRKEVKRIGKKEVARREAFFFFWKFQSFESYRVIYEKKLEQGEF